MTNVLIKMPRPIADAMHNNIWYGDEHALPADMIAVLRGCLKDALASKPLNERGTQE
jgi:hypothetical protein